MPAVTRNGHVRSGWQSERRTGGDRRGSGHRFPPSGASRAYGFREFNDRRRHPAGWLYDDDDVVWEMPRSYWPDPVWCETEPHGDDTLIDVTPDHVNRSRRER